MKDNTDKTFILVGLVTLGLLLLHMLPSITIGDTTLRHVSILGDISSSPLDKEVSEVIPKPKEPKRETKKIVNDKGEKVIYKEIWPKGVQRIIDFSEGKDGGMEHFYAMLDSLKRNKSVGRPVRIAYYGDSFIEADILVSDLREMMQDKYGGWGVGWIDAGNDLTQYKRTIKNSFSGIREYMVMKRDSYSYKKGGIAERYYTVSDGANIYLHSEKEYPHTAHWNVARLYYNAPSDMYVSIDIKGGITEKRQLGGLKGLNVIETRLPMNNIRYSFSGNNATIFGIALESDNGIIIDNFSMRGSSGISLARIPELTLRQFNQKRPYDLIVLQFGVNAISQNTKPKEMQGYINNMRNVIKSFRKCFPETSIILVSTPDRGARTTNGTGTMKGIEMLVAYQERLASECRIGFYDLFNAMGGEGSMVRLTGQGMGSKDFVHINHKGGKVVSKHIFDSFVAGQENWSRRQDMVKGDNN